MGVAPHSPDLKRTYLEEGYVVADGLVSQAQIAAVLTDLNNIVRAQLAHHRLPAVAGADIERIYENLKTLRRHDQQLYLSTLGVFNKLRSLYDLFLDASISDVCRQLGVALPMLHTLPIFHIMSHALAIDDGYHGFEAHQDWSGLQTSVNTVVVWLPFHDVDGRRFPLEVLPRSHREGVRDGIGNVASDRFIRVDVPIGSAVLMSCFTIHRTSMTRTGAIRLAASWRYEDAIEKTFVARGFPFAQTRTIDHGLIFPGFPDAEAMRDVLG